MSQWEETDFQMKIFERGRVDWTQQYSRTDPRRQHVQIEVHALTPNLRFALLAKSNAARHRCRRTGGAYHVRFRST
jgi:hypothetical protein